MRLVDRLLAAAAVLLVTGLLASVVAGALFRSINQPLGWAEELAQHFLVWTGFLGWMIASRKRAHIRITILIDLLPTPARRGLEVCIQLVVILFAVLLLRQSFALIGRNWDVEAVSLPIPAALLYLPLPAAAAALVVAALADIAASLRGEIMAAPAPERTP